MQAQISENAQNYMAVSQYAKKYGSLILKSKTLKNNELAVRRHISEISHTLTHTRENLQNKPLVADFHGFELQKNKNIDLLQLFPSLIKNAQNVEVKLHNIDYIESIYAHYESITAHKFLEWVKTFALIRKETRSEILENVIETNDDDFLLALRLFKAQKTKTKVYKIPHRDTVLQIININFSDKAFSLSQLKQYINLDHLRAVLREMEQDQILEFAGTIKNISYYKLTGIEDERFTEQKPISKLENPIPKTTEPNLYRFY